MGSNNGNGGPATQSGKAVVRWNATSHGISSPEPVIPGVESAEDWQSHRAGIMESISPAGHLEYTLTERVALMSWRLHRVLRFETEAISLQQEKIEETIHERDRFKRAVLGSYGSEPGSITDPTHPEDIRGEAEDSRTRHNSLKRFASLSPEKKMKGSGPSDVLHGALVRARRATGAEIDEEDLTLPGVGEDETLLDLPPMRVSDIQACVEEIACYAALDTDELLEAATEEARRESIRSAHKLGQTEREIDRHSREYLLPTDKQLEKISRYEAHLSRQMYQALHELEALQKRRLSGEDTPLARLEVNGANAGSSNSYHDSG